MDEAVNKLKISESRGVPAVDRLEALEAGENEPSRPMLIKMAKQYHRPLLAFYMSEPPRKGNRGQDFRTLPDGCTDSEEALLDALIRDVQARQGIVRAIIEEEDDVTPLPFIGSVSTADGIPNVLASIKDILQVDIEELRGQSSPEKVFALLRDRVEEAGIFVLLIGNLGSHHTAIDLEIFRGFALADEIAPFVIINDQDAHSAWSFTLIHELVHLWLGQTGVSGVRAEIAVERFCNDVAGEFLLPSQELAGLDIQDHSNLQTVQNIISDFARERNISSSMVAYKLFRLDLISHDSWDYLSRVFRELWMDGRQEKKMKSRERGSTGPDYYVVRRQRVGRTLINFVDRMIASGEITTSKAAKVLGVKASNVQSLVDIARTI